MSIRFVAAALFLMVVASAAAVAQEDQSNLVYAAADDSQAQITQRERNDAGADEIRALVFSPEFIMANRREISLTDRQRNQIVTDLQGLQRQLIAQQDEMQNARQALIQALRTEPANEAHVLSALDAVLNIERDVKRLQLQALVHLRDSLTPSQRAQLNELRNSH